MEGFEDFVQLKNQNLLNAFTFAIIEDNLAVVRALCEKCMINLSIMSRIENIK